MAALAFGNGATAAGRRAHGASGPLPAARAFIANFAHHQRPSDQPVVDLVLVDDAPLQARIDRGAAMVVAPVLYSYEVKGAVVVEPARMAITLRRDQDGWRITGWAWAGGSDPQADQATQMQFLPRG